MNYRLKQDDIAYIFDHGDVDLIIVDKEFEPLLATYRSRHPNVPFLVDDDKFSEPWGVSGNGDFGTAIQEGWAFDQETGQHGWEGLESQAPDEDSIIALAYTSGTTARPKGVEFTHRGCYLATLANVVESGLNFHNGRAKYLWTLPMFHAMGLFHLTDLTSELTANLIDRLDIPMGCDRCSRNSLLSPQDRLPRDLETAEGGAYHSFQCRTDCQYAPL